MITVFDRKRTRSAPSLSTLTNSKMCSTRRGASSSMNCDERGDALVRAGGCSWGVENRIKELKGNIALNRKDLDENEKRRQELEARLKNIEQKLS